MIPFTTRMNTIAFKFRKDLKKLHMAKQDLSRQNHDAVGQELMKKRLATVAGVPANLSWTNLVSYAREIEMEKPRLADALVDTAVACGEAVDKLVKQDQFWIDQLDGRIGAMELDMFEEIGNAIAQSIADGIVPSEEWATNANFSGVKSSLVQDHIVISYVMGVAASAG